jgi:hypothetical protein
VVVAITLFQIAPEGCVFGQERTLLLASRLNCNSKSLDLLSQ